MRSGPVVCISRASIAPCSVCIPAQPCPGEGFDLMWDSQRKVVLHSPVFSRLMEFHCAQRSDQYRQCFDNDNLAFWLCE